MVIGSCSANWHLNKAKKKGINLKVDTVYKSVQVVTERYQVDTVLKVANIHDTIRFETERVKWRTKYDTINKTVYFDVECKPDTIKVEVPVMVTTEAKTNPVVPFWVWVIFGFLCFLVFYRAMR
jgi:hypothetical protein